MPVQLGVRGYTSRERSGTATHLRGGFEEREVGNKYVARGVIFLCLLVKERRTFQAHALVGGLERRCAEAPVAAVKAVREYPVVRAHLAPESERTTLFI